MPTKLFASMGLAICALVYLILVFIMYLSKKKFKTFENNVFLFMFFLTFLLVINEFLYIYAMYAELDGNILFLPTKPLCYTYIFGSIVWFACLILYIWSIREVNTHSDKSKIQKKFIVAIISVLVFVMFVISCVLDLNYPTSKSNLYVFSGPAVYTIYIIAISVLIVVVISVIRSGKTIPKHQKIPIYFCLLTLILVNAIQLITDYDLNSLTFLYTFVITTLYFTIESQDYKLIDNLERRREESEIANKAQTEFLANMSHEIRTPLNTILGFSESLLSEDTLSKEKVDKDVNMIHAASINLLELINNILDVSRLESGKEQLEEREYQLQNLIFEIDSLISSKIDKKSSDFKINLNKEIPSTYYGDYGKIYKILICILNNALKYTEYGQIKLDVDGSKVENDMFEFKYTISNAGHAMKAENFEVDFNDFVKLGTGLQNNIDATALGLILAKRLIKMLGGSIEFVNKTGEGTKYLISINQKIVNNNKVGDIYNSETKSEEVTNYDHSDKKILVVDDNNLNIKLACRLLENYKFKIDTATSGKECIEKVQHDSYDLIFLDHMMPEMDGIETLRTLKKNPNFKSKVVVLTANASDGLREKYKSAGFDDYLSKPINIKDLNKIIDKIFK